MFNIEGKTRGEMVTDLVRAIDAHSVASVENAKINYQTAFDMLWNTPNLTAQEVCDSLGNQAYKLFETAMKWIQLIQQFDPNWVYPPAPNLFTVNQDGTVTIGEPIEEEPVSE